MSPIGAEGPSGHKGGIHGRSEWENKGDFYALLLSF